MLGCHPKSAVDVTDGAPTPFGGFLPVQRKLEASHQAHASGIGRSQGCARGLFLVAEVDERRPVQVSFEREPQARPRMRLGLAILPCARVVKGRREPVPGGDIVVPVTGCLRSRSPHRARPRLSLVRDRRRHHSSREGVLVSGKSRLLTKPRQTGNLAACPGLKRELEPNRRAATGDARGYATSSVCGRKRHRRETRHGEAAIEASPGLRGVLA
jgi:hypothetical protein